MKNRFRIYLDIGGETLMLPVLPKENPVKYPSSTKKYNIMGVGDIIVPQSPGLIKVTASSYFPGNESDPLLLGRWRKPGRYIEMLEAAREDGSIIDVLVCRGRPAHDTNISAVITNFETTDKGGEPGDVYYKLELTEYRDYGPSKIILPAPAGEAAQGLEAPMPATEETERPVTTPDLYVGAQVIANGPYFNDSYGGKPSYTANNLATAVSRIIDDPARAYPILIGDGRGWMKREHLQVVK